MVEDDEKFAKDLLCTECWEVGLRLVFSDELHSNDGEPLMIKHIPKNRYTPSGGTRHVRTILRTCDL
jgi:hypothetical protein